MYEETRELINYHLNHPEFDDIRSIRILMDAVKINLHDEKYVLGFDGWERLPDIKREMIENIELFERYIKYAEKRINDYETGQGK